MNETDYMIIDQNGIPNSFMSVKTIMIPYLNIPFNITEQTDILQTDSLTYVVYFFYFLSCL